MAEISSYPKIQPKAQDLLLGSRTYVEGVDEFTGNPTSVFTVGAIADLVEQDSGSSLYTTKTVELTPAQMLSLNGDGALELIPAPGAGKIIVVSEIFLFVDYNSVPYDFAAGVAGQGRIIFNYGTTIVFSLINFSSLLNASSDLYFSASTDIYAEANKPFNLLAHSGVIVTQGDSPVKINVVYRILNSTTLL
jgi:hypothetical protein